MCVLPPGRTRSFSTDLCGVRSLPGVGKCWTPGAGQQPAPRLPGGHKSGLQNRQSRSAAHNGSRGSLARSRRERAYSSGGEAQSGASHSERWIERELAWLDVWSVLRRYPEEF
jgi:hypothetical protein